MQKCVQTGTRRSHQDQDTANGSDIRKDFLRGCWLPVQFLFRRLFRAVVSVQHFQHADGAVGDDGARREYGGSAGGIERVEILWRDHAAGEEAMVLGARGGVSWRLYVR